MLLGNQPPGSTHAEKPATACANSSSTESRWLVTTVLNRRPRTGRAVKGDDVDPGVPTAPGL